MERKTFAEKDKMIAQAMRETKKGLTKCQTKRGKTSSYGTIETEYGDNPVPHK